MKKTQQITGFIFPFLLLATCFVILSPKTNAQTPTCTPLYGGGTSCERHPDISIDKQVQDPQTKKLLDNITTVSNYLPSNQAITFRITIKNTSNKTVSNISVTDILPTSLTFKSGNGKYDAKTRTFSDTIQKLDKGQTSTHTITATVDIEALRNMPACSVNQATVIQANRRGSDYVQFCINVSQSATSPTPQAGVLGRTQATTTKGGLPIYGQKPQSKTPDTGPEMLALLALPSLAGAGYYLRKSSNRFKKHDS